MKEEKELDIIDKLLDEENIDNIFLTHESGKSFEFEQIALIPLENDGVQDLYAILLPVEAGVVDDGEAIVVEIDEKERTVKSCQDEAIIDRVIVEYEKLLAEGEADK